MAQIKLRIELNKGRMGAPLEKLGDVARQMERFLRALAADLDLEVKRGEWLAINFKNGSVAWDASYQNDVSDAQFRRFNQCVEFITDYDPDTEDTNALVSDLTLLEYGKIGEHIDPDEVIGVGIYGEGRKKLRWRRIEYRNVSRIRRAIERPLESYGSIQGMMHSLVKGVQRPYFQIREFGSDQLVRCYFDMRLYAEVPSRISHRSGYYR